jgi:hypothetical protein
MKIQSKINEKLTPSLENETLNPKTPKPQNI